METRKAGFTLIELVVYMAIMGFIIVVAGRVFSDSTSMRVRSQNMLKSAEVSGRVSALIKEDLSQMGAKAWGRDTTEGFKVSVAEKVYFEPANPILDSSSYEFIRKPSGDTTFYDSIVFNKAEFNDDGKFLGVRQVSWAANERGELRRRCRTIEPSTCNATNDPNCSICPTNPSNMNDAPAVLIAENLKRFALTPSKPGIISLDASGSDPDTLFPPSGTSNFWLAPRASQDYIVNTIISSDPNSDIVVVKGDPSQNKNDSTGKKHAEVYLVATNAEPWSNCLEMPLKAGETYAVEFNMPYEEQSDSAGTYNSTQFLPGIDHIAVGLREAGGADIVGTKDVLFYPPQSKEARTLARHAEFSVNRDVNACVALTFAFYSKNRVNEGAMRFNNFKVLHKTDEAFHFPKNESYGVGNTKTQTLIREKKTVKAFELAMEIEYNGEKVNTYTKSEADGTISNGMIITTPNNGIVSATGGSQ